MGNCIAPLEMAFHGVVNYYIWSFVLYHVTHVFPWNIKVSVNLFQEKSQEVMISVGPKHGVAVITHIKTNAVSRHPTYNFTLKEKILMFVKTQYNRYYHKNVFHVV